MATIIFWGIDQATFEKFTVNFIENFLVVSERDIWEILAVNLIYTGIKQLDSGKENKTSADMKKTFKVPALYLSAIYQVLHMKARLKPLI